MQKMPGGGKMYDSMPGGGRLMEYMMAGGKLMMGEKGLKMVKNDKGEMVPFFAADGKGKMEAGGKMMRGYKMGQEGMKNDSPRMSQRDVDRQVEKLKKERDMLIGGDLVKGGSMFAEANPDMRGLRGFGSDSKTAASIRNFYDSEIEAIMKQGAKDTKVDSYDRKEFLKMLKDDMKKKGKI